ncbi:MAG: alpha/beta hydrolase, partial [Rubrobacteraceae bacterium]
MNFHEVSFRTEDGVDLSAWWIPSEGASRAAVLVHGQASSKSGRHVIETALVYASAGYGVLMLDLRGHGESGWARRTLGLKEVRDVRAALGWLGKVGLDPDQIVLHGWSAGAATVLRAAPGTGVAAVVEESGYADLPPLLRAQLPEQSGLPAFFNPGVMLASKLFLRADPWSIRPEIEARELYRKNVPLFVIHSEGDQVVPVEHADRIVSAHPGARFWKLNRYAHV